MKNIRKIIIITIICLLITTSVTTSFAFQKNNSKNNNHVDTSITCYTINKKGFPTLNSNLISYEAAQFLLDKIKELENEIATNPNSIKTKQLQDEIVDLAKKHKLITNDFSFEQIRNQITNRFFPMSFLKTKQSKTSTHASEWFCNFASVGEGSSLPVIILPRLIPILVAPIPRVYMRWEAQDGYTSCGGLLSGTGFLASGELNGFALGFWGIGFSIFLPPIMAYGLFGYALFASVNAEDIEFYPPNSKPQISNPNPSNGENNVPITLSELNFRIDDADNELMSYSVTSDPDIGSGNGNLKGNGFYTIPVGNIQSSTKYSWQVSVSDGKDTTDKTYTFTTEYLAPVLTNPVPVNMGSTSVDLTHLQFTLTDAQGDLMDYTVETSPYIGSGSASNVPDGTYTVPVHGLKEETWYHWYVNVTDGVHWTRGTFSFFVGGFYDDFNDNTKDYSKWTEIYNDGVWEEINSRCEFEVHEPGSGDNLQGIKSTDFSISLNPDTPLIINWDLIADIKSTNWAGDVRLEVSDGTNWLVACYSRWHKATRYIDSNDGVWTNLNNNKPYGTWNNEIQLYSDRYIIRMDSDNTEPIYDLLFSPNKPLYILIYLKSSGDQTNLYYRSGFDNIQVKFDDLKLI